MSYKILHFSDLHLDTSFAGQGFPVEYGNERRLGLRATLTSIFSKAREYRVDAVTIGGDLFAQKYLHPETVDFMQQQFALLDPIRVIIAPGIQDLYTNESVYAQFDWPKNVDIYHNNKLTCKELTPDIYLWGACNPPARGYKLLDDFQPQKGINILLLHATKEISSNQVHTVDTDGLQKAGFRLTLLGGEHKSEISKTEIPLRVYPGSPEPLSPLEENGLHQVSLVEIDGENIRVQFLTFQQWHYQNIEVDLTSCISNVDAALQIDEALVSETAKMPHSAITVFLNGKPHFDLDMSRLTQLIQTSAFFRLKSNLGLGYDIEQLASEQTVRGLVARRFQERIDNTENESERRLLLTAVQFALQALEGKQVSLYETKAN